MPKFAVETESSFNEVDAEYYVIEDGFVTFKDANHKQVASFNDRHVIGVVKVLGASTSIGSVTVQVVPEIDAKAFKRLMDDVEKRASQATGTRRH